MEALTGLIIKGNEVRFLKGIHINGPCVEDVLISHLLFVDDTLIFGRGKSYGLFEVYPYAF